MIFDADTQEAKSKADSYLERNIKAPYVYVQISALGGVSHASAMIKASLDRKSEWANGILQNSRYFMIRLERNGEMEMFSKSYQLKLKMRKTKVASMLDAVERINKYISSVK